LRRTILVSLVPAAVIAAAWLRLEHPVNEPLRSAAVAGLALLPALVRPLAARMCLLVVSLALAAWIAFDASPLHPRGLPGAIGPHFADGFLDFYDVRTPFDPRVHADMRAVLLSALFAFVFALGVAVAARRPVAAALVLLAGAGWPATLHGNAGAVAFGVLILLGALALLAGLTSRRVPRGALPATVGLALAAIVATSSSAVAKGGLLSWQRWDPYNAPQQPVSVSFVWNARYDGVRFPRKRTTVLEIKAPKRSLYWRAAVLDSFERDGWLESEPLRADALVPLTTKLVRQEVHVLALSDTRLVGASIPLRFDAGEAPVVSRVPGIAQLESGLTRGFRYTVWSEAPEPTAAALARSKPVYPIELTEPGTFLDVPGGTMPSFGRSRRIESRRYAPLERAALAVAGGARTPYAAAAALETWFRDNGGFTYTNRPVGDELPPLVSFVTRTRAGYCQHFAGAMALMLRYLGVPARVAVGFSSGTYDAKKGLWRVTDHDAHAWVEAWFRGYGWLPFDPTPAAGRPERGQLSAPYAAAARAGLSGGSGPVGRRGSTDPRLSAHRHGEQEGTGLRALDARGAARPQSGSRGGSLLLLLAILVGAAFGAVAATKLVLRYARYVTRDPRRVAAACRRQLADFLVDQNIGAARSATLHELGAIVRHELAVDPDAFVAAATAARFGPPAGAARAAREARRELRALLRRMRGRLRTRDRVRGVVSLRSLGFSA
jgi:transglutaminase-like putative cysteine protease